MSGTYADLREVILADEDLAAIGARVADSEVQPWVGFARSASLVGADSQAAIAVLREVLSLPGLEARVHLQVWRCLRELGEAPDAAEARVVRGVVVEMGLEQGTDVVAAYADRSARYFNQGGGGAFWDRPTDALDSLIDDYLAAGQAVADATGPMQGSLPAPAADGVACVLLLTYGGIHVGHGPAGALMADPLGGRVIGAAVPLMQAIINLVAEDKNASGPV